MKRINRNPLRKIIAKEVEPFEPPFEQMEVGDGTILSGFLRERLECGHLVPIKEDRFGQTNAERRRCKECGGSVRSDTP